MSMKRVVMPSPVGVGVGQTASVDLPRGLTYERIDIEAQADFGAGLVDVPAAKWADLIQEIRLIVNGQVLIRGSGAYFAARAQYYGLAMEDGNLSIHLASPWMKLPDGQFAGAYGTIGLQSFKLEVQFKSAGITSIGSVEVYAYQSAGQPFRSHLQIQEYTHQQGAAGQASITNVPPAGLILLSALHIETASIGLVQVEADGVEVHKSTAIGREVMANEAGRVNQSGYTHIDFSQSNLLARMQSMAVNDWRVKPTFTAGGSYIIRAEMIKGIV